ncbi:Arginase/deacetylase, partial [Atractiella rhizophila]
DCSFEGINTFAHLPHNPCLSNLSAEYDIAILGAPFDTTTTFRPGARFGPHGIRTGSRRQRPAMGYSSRLEVNPYASGYRVLDCGDVPMSPFSN